MTWLKEPKHTEGCKANGGGGERTKEEGGGGGGGGGKTNYKGSTYDIPMPSLSHSVQRTQT